MTIFYDLSAASDGSGSEASPYNTITHFTGLTGDQSGEVHVVKVGNVLTGNIINTSAFNYRLGTYQTNSVPGAKPIIDATGNNYGIQVSGNDIALEHFEVKNALEHGVLVDSVVATCNNLGIRDMNIHDISGGAVQNAILIKPSLSSTGIQVLGNILSDCFNGIETYNTNGMLISGNIMTTLSGTGIEYWKGAVNCVAEFNQITDAAQRGYWLANLNGAGTEIYTGNIFRNNLIERAPTAIQVSAGSITATTNECYNNTLIVTKLGRALWAMAGSQYGFENNVCYFSPIDATGAGNGLDLATGTDTGSTINNNYYYLEESAFRSGVYSMPKFKIGVTTYQTGDTSASNSLRSFAGDAALLDVNSTGGTEHGDPFVDYANGDYRLKSTGAARHDLITTSPQVSTGVAAVSSGKIGIDLYKKARYGENDLGSIQFQRHPTINTSMKP